jgi:hypothetical protein
MLLAAGLDAGLAAMGVPPSIPNFDQLAQLGKGYLAQTLADQAAQAGYPIPPDYQAWYWTIEAERRRTVKQFVSNGEMMQAWQNAHDSEKNTLFAHVSHADAPTRYVAAKSATFVPAAGYSG